MTAALPPADWPPPDGPPGNRDRQRVWAALLIIGDEILSGRTQDTNLRALADFLRPLGVSLREVRVVADDHDAIVMAINALRAANDYLFTTGGIGPTHDDITVDAVAAAFGRAVIEHPEAVALLTAHYPPGELTPARRRMTRVPEGAALIANPVSKAPGFVIGNVLVLAGVPRVMRAMLEDATRFIHGGIVTAAVEWRAVGALEGRIAASLEALAGSHTEFSFGSYPFYQDGQFGVSLVVRGPDGPGLNAAGEELAQLLRAAGHAPELVTR